MKVFFKMDDFIWFVTIFVAAYSGSFLAVVTAVWFFDSSKKKEEAQMDTSTAAGLTAASVLAAESSTGTNISSATRDIFVPVGDYPPPYTA